MSIFGKTAALALALAMTACAALAENTAAEAAEQPAAQTEEAAEVTAQTEDKAEQLTLEQAIALAQEAYPDYTFTLKKKVSRGGVKYYRLKGTSADDTKRVYVSMDDGTLLTKKQYKALKKSKKDKDED